MTTREMSVSTPTTGRTTEGSLQFLTTPKICVRTGTQSTSLLATKMAVSKNTSVHLAMAGKNKNSTLITLK